MGASLVTMAKARRSRTSSVSKSTRRAWVHLATAHEEGVENLRVMCHDAVEVLHKMIPDNSLTMVQLFSLTRGTKHVIINAVSFRRRLPSW
jgi:tRNA (guanine-N7-)-methyltransferase